MTSTSAVESTREPNFLLARHEKRALTAIARRLPRWILPDDLTALGVVAAVAICIAYQATNVSPGWLWVASGLLVVHWLGDSLDGTLARVRGIERPRYGYYLDHLVDAISTAFIGISLFSNASASRERVRRSATTATFRTPLIRGTAV